MPKPPPGGLSGTATRALMMASQKRMGKMIEFTISMSEDGARRLSGTIGMRRAKLAGNICKYIEDGERSPEQEIFFLRELDQVYDTIATAIKCAGKPINKPSEKQPPVDRGKLLIGLEVCRQKEKCSKCPYYDDRSCGATLSNDSLSYICYLEEQLKEARKHDCG